MQSRRSIDSGTGIPPVTIAAEDLSLLERGLARGELLASQLPSRSQWSPEKLLAAAVLSSALNEVRDHHRDRHYRHQVAMDLRWIHSNDAIWPFSFLRLCGLFGLDPDWVRQTVRRWGKPRSEPVRRPKPFRNAA